MYVGIPKNQMSLIVIESISMDGIVIPLIVIMPSIMIIVS
jgi:hypothetical protein